MKLSSRDLQNLAEQAILAAVQAGKWVASAAPAQKITQFKPGGNTLASQVVTEVDLRSQQIILDTLSPSLERYHLGLLTEEGADDHSRFERDFFWCVDPLDGTLCFTENQPGFSISIALVSKEGVPQIGVVHDPIQQKTYHAIKGGGCFVNGSAWKQNPWESGSTETLTWTLDRSFESHQDFEKTKVQMEEVAQEFGCTHLKLIKQGGAVMNALWALESPLGCYFKFPKPQLGGGSVWDFAATACLFSELQCSVSDFQGEPLNLNGEQSLFMNRHGVIFANHIALFKRILGIQGAQKPFGLPK